MLGVQGQALAQDHVHAHGQTGTQQSDASDDATSHDHAGHRQHGDQTTAPDHVHDVQSSLPPRTTRSTATMRTITPRMQGMRWTPRRPRMRR
jgi:hypothetical protein